MNDPVLGAVGGLLGEIRKDTGEEPCVVNRAVIVCETLDFDGERGLRIIRDGNLTTWDVRGMLSEVIADLNTFDLVSAMEEEG